MAIKMMCMFICVCIKLIFLSPYLRPFFQVNLGKPVLLELRMMEVAVTTGAIRRAKIQSNHQHATLPSVL